MAFSTSSCAIVGESKAAINRVTKPTQSWMVSSSWVPSQVYPKLRLQREDSLTSCLLLSVTISRMRLWRLEDFWRIYATWRTTISCWAFVVFNSTSFLEGVKIGAKSVGHSSTVIVGSDFLSSLISGVPAWVPTKVVGVTDLDWLAELLLVGAWNVCAGVDKRSAWRSSMWSLPAGLCERKDGIIFLTFSCADLKKGFIVSSKETRESSPEFDATWRQHCTMWWSIRFGLCHGSMVAPIWYTGLQELLHVRFLHCRLTVKLEPRAWSAPKVIVERICNCFSVSKIALAPLVASKRLNPGKAFPYSARLGFLWKTLAQVTRIHNHQTYKICLL